MSHDGGHTRENDAEPRGKHDGVYVVPDGRLDPNTARMSGMFRQAEINHACGGAQKIWAGAVAIEPKAKTGETPGEAPQVDPMHTHP